MAEYIDIDAPIDVAVYQRNRRIQVTLRQILESNDARYERADVRPVVKAIWQYKTMTVPGGKGQTYAKWCCTACKGKAKERTNFCPNCGADMRVEEGE